MSLSRRKRKGNISMGKLPPPVGFQIMPASAGGGTNAAAMRPTYAFLAADADQLNKRIYAAKSSWLSLNPTKTEADFEGIPDPYGTGTMIGVGGNVSRRNAGQATCRNGQQWNETNNRCECPSDTHPENIKKDGVVQSYCVQNAWRS
jgi:hypothetical protein